MFVWQCFGSGEVTGVSSVRTCEKPPLFLIEPMLATSKTDSPMTKAEPISDNGSTSGTANLSRVKSYSAGAIAVGERNESM